MRMEMTDAGPHRRAGQPAVPRRDDAGPLGRRRTRPSASGSSTARSTPASTSSTPPTSTRTASPRRSSARRSRAGATTSSWPPSSTARWATTQPQRQLAALDRARGRGQPAPARHRLDRPLPGAPPRPDTDIDETLGALSDLVHAGQGPLHRHVDVPGRADRRGAVGRRASADCERFAVRAAAVLDPRPRRSSATCCRSRSATAWACIAVEPARPGAGSSGRYRAGRDAADLDPGRAPCPQRFDPALPENAAQARGRRAAGRRWPRRRGVCAGPAGAGVRARAPGGDLGDHRAAHDRAARGQLATPTRCRSTRRPRPDRRDRAAGHRLQPGGHRMGRTRAPRRLRAPRWCSRAHARGARSAARARPRGRPRTRRRSRPRRPRSWHPRAARSARASPSRTRNTQSSVITTSTAAFAVSG